MHRTRRIEMPAVRAVALPRELHAREGVYIGGLLGTVVAAMMILMGMI